MAEPRRGKNGKNGKPGGGRASATGASLADVREILFGAQVQEYERRLAQVEEQTEKTAAELRSQVEAIERYVQNEVNTLIERIKHEVGSQRNLLVETLHQRHQEATQLISAGLRELRPPAAGSDGLSNLLMEVAARLNGDPEDEAPAEVRPAPRSGRASGA